MTAEDAERLKAGLDEDERVAKAAASVAGPGWQFGHIWPEGGPSTMALLSGRTPLADTLHRDDEEIAPHAARHDPERVLHEVAAKRAILALHEEHAALLEEQLADPAVKAVGPGVRTAADVLGQVVAALASVYTEAEKAR